MKLEHAFGLSYADIGDKDATPVLYMHGSLGSYLELNHFQKTAQLRMIAINRPGRSSSKFIKLSSIYQFTDSIKQIADHLNLKRFGIVGFSGGAPFALACAKAFPQRLLFVKDIAGWAPFHLPEVHALLSKRVRFGFELGVNIPPLLHLAYFYASHASKTYSDIKFLKVLRRWFSTNDANWLDLHIKEVKSNMAEAFKTSIKGALQDALLYKSDWEFSLHEVDYPVEIHHGVKDYLFSSAFAEYKKAHLKNSTLILHEERGHLDILDLIPKICQKQMG